MAITDEKAKAKSSPDSPGEFRENTQPRPPVVAVVGHVDHGKTTLLDYIRKESVAEKEAGGITQSIGAYEIKHGGKKITFIDTPGHEAFSTMRAHGTAAADLAVLVIAADEGIKPQTTEAIDVLKKTETPFVVAITKIDSAGADVEKVKNELISAGVLLEGAGGDVSWHKVSGKSGEGVDDLLGLIILAGEVAGLSFDPGGRAHGFVLEAKKDNQRGNIAHVVLKDGVLRRGDEIVTQSVSGKIKALENFLGKDVMELIPSSPAVVCGFEKLPRVGEEFWAGDVDLEVVGVLGEAREELEDIAEAISYAPDGGELEEPAGEKIKAVLKADTTGSLEALKQVLGHVVQITESSVGDISDNDVKFARSSGSVIIGFNTAIEKTVEKLAETHEVKVITSDIIYKLLEAVESLERKQQEEKTGGALEVLKVFSATVSKQTIGGKVVDGKITLGARAEIEREGESVGRGRIKSLQQNKADAKEVAVGNEAGLVVETETKIENGDILKIA